MSMSTQWNTGSRSNIHLTYIPLADQDLKLNTGVQVLADINNTGKVYIGAGTGVTAAGADGTTGFPLTSGDSVLLPIRSIRDVYCIGSASGQKVWWMAF